MSFFSEKPCIQCPDYLPPSLIKECLQTCIIHPEQVFQNRQGNVCGQIHRHYHEHHLERVHTVHVPGRCGIPEPCTMPRHLRIQGFLQAGLVPQQHVGIVLRDFQEKSRKLPVAGKELIVQVHHCGNIIRSRFREGYDKIFSILFI